MKFGIHSPSFIYNDANILDEYQAASVQMLICNIYQNDVETLELLSELKEEFGG